VTGTTRTGAGAGTVVVNRHLMSHALRLVLRRSGV
jgi:choline dehydrogenase-like flavoprotein